MTRCRFLLLPTTLAVLIVIAMGAPRTANAKTVANPHGVVTVRAGQSLTLSFQVSGGVGLSWALRSHTRPDLLSLGKVTVTSNNPDPQAVGGYSTKRWNFVAHHGGRARLVFVRDERGTSRDRVVVVRII